MDTLQWLDRMTRVLGGVHTGRVVAFRMRYFVIGGHMYTCVRRTAVGRVLLFIASDSGAI